MAAPPPPPPPPPPGSLFRPRPASASGGGRHSVARAAAEQVQKRRPGSAPGGSSRRSIAASGGSAGASAAGGAGSSSSNVAEAAAAAARARMQKRLVAAEGNAVPQPWRKPTPAAGELRTRVASAAAARRSGRAAAEQLLEGSSDYDTSASEEEGWSAGGEEATWGQPAPVIEPEAAPYGQRGFAPHGEGMGLPACPSACLPLPCVAAFQLLLLDAKGAAHRVQGSVHRNAQAPTAHVGLAAAGTRSSRQASTTVPLPGTAQFVRSGSMAKHATRLLEAQYGRHHTPAGALDQSRSSGGQSRSTGCSTRHACRRGGLRHLARHQRLRPSRH
jgi:hypothetical protein